MHLGLFLSLIPCGLIILAEGTRGWNSRPNRNDRWVQQDWQSNYYPRSTQRPYTNYNSWYNDDSSRKKATKFERRSGDNWEEKVWSGDGFSGRSYKSEDKDGRGRRRMSSYSSSSDGRGRGQSYSSQSQSSYRS